MKKEFNIKNTFIITGIIQALFLALYAIALLLIPFMPTLPPQIHFQFAATLSVIPVMPVCLIWNTLALSSNGNATSTSGSNSNTHKGI